MASSVVLDVQPVAGAVGAEIHGVDLSAELQEATFRAIRAAFNEHGVVFFRDQQLTTEQYEAFASRFGKVLTIQELRKEPDQTRNIGESWHVDMTFRAEPPMATMLYALECPLRGGDTMFSSMARAYETLSEGLQRTLEGLYAVHANVRKLGLSYEQTDPPEPSVSEYDAAEGVLHPVVTRHPETGQKVLYVNAEYTTRFAGWTRRESVGLLQHLLLQGQRPELTCRFRWSEGAIALWDNRQVWHLAVNDYNGLRRVMRRIVVGGTRPLAASPE